MQLLKDRIQKEAVVLPGNIIKIDGFLNHLVDVEMLHLMALEFRARFPQKGITKILTVEASGIALGAAAAQIFAVPMLFAKKAKSDNIEGGLFRSDIFSYTYNKKVTLIVSRQWLTPDDTVLIVDDFLARGEALRGLCEIVAQAGAKLAGIGVAVEKGFQGGGDALRQRGVNLQSLAIIDHAEPGTILFRD
jgi:xanthine phosphoribosyltransferase